MKETKFAVIGLLCSISFVFLGTDFLIKAVTGQLSYPLFPFDFIMIGFGFLYIDVLGISMIYVYMDFLWNKLRKR